MQQICLALPVRMGRTDLARRLVQELGGDRCDQHDRFERRLGVAQAACYLAGTPLGDLLIGYLELESTEHAERLLPALDDRFGVWLSTGLRDVTGIDLQGRERPQCAELLGRWVAR